ncbi:hypothetical protein IEN85_05095 [Pelagicoccus sp. NFK12]|uniref:Uncharacterized protein n=1 Tax=Pelagicoccus enzymogenes TaxID=2773457 RepID=A0A927IGN3_9BACT|nr:hypothetical protein [Pelagicoccus enzymogenes]MBD5778858.1 hypothetical protein [Pelagicoccus enzymogenes]MDQ8197397.1 hypothetical protein [Pelagicoccus enzymogenes]
MKRRLLPYAFTLIFLLLQSGCENTLPEFRRFEIVENASRVLVLDRHGLYFDEVDLASQIGIKISGPDPKPAHQPPASQTMPRWLQDFDDAVYLHVQSSLSERRESSWNYELVFPLSSLPPAYPSLPYKQVGYWPEPMPPEEVIAHAAEHEAQAVIVLESLVLTFVDTSAETTPPHIGAPPNLSPSGHIQLHMTGAFRSYDGKTGEEVDAQKFNNINAIPWQRAGTTTSTATSSAALEKMKTDLARAALEEIIKLVDKALIARDIKVQ